ncbi:MULTISPECIES: MgtC/SapB family protein [Burkholderia]|uniref:MgtC/SapB family protein n=1 Tax=Burkholderia TaxID=32008 RepID=UPI000841717B|nr:MULTISPECIES: MgtC/SapB family protein [Burkholderia]AOJ40993.1 methyltransferase [Burkholderia lata]NIE58469.1 MgtC/SapB family protein [Burkholderia sp. Ap-955]NIF13596.1 MgtC/SapB family protein [Burkholderia sp. Ax-1735]NIG03135.1 MgtC/SapB family protein [Burkholderia sp. Tr-849]OXJ29175.1 methyltransferase [Burkholderia sp. HI2714]
MISQLEIVSRLLLAALLGSIVGIERERLSWAAGLRTHMLVAVGAALVMVVSAFGFADIQNAKNVSLDPSRVAAQVVSGIGFLGAGSIMLRGEIIRGLTTAASLWVVAAVGLAVGGGMYVAAIAATAIVLAILAGLKPIEKRFFAARQRWGVRILARRGAVKLTSLQAMPGIDQARIVQFIIEQDDAAPDDDRIHVVFSKMTSREFQAVRQSLQTLVGIKKMEESAA